MYEGILHLTVFSSMDSGLGISGFHNIFFIVFALVIGVFIFTILRGIKEWHYNNQQPILDVEAKVVTKRHDVRYRGNSKGTSNRSSTYYATFEFNSGDRLELRVPDHQYGMLVEGDIGTLKFQGRRYLDFTRKRRQSTPNIIETSGDLWARD